MEILVTAREEVVTIIELTEREVVRLPKTWQTLRVLRGNAWVTDATGDRLLWPGDAAVFAPIAKTPAIVGGLGGNGLVLELTGEEAAEWSLKTYAAAKRRAAAKISLTQRIMRTVRNFWMRLRGRFGGRHTAEAPPCASICC